MPTIEKSLTWNKCQNDVWCPLGTVDVDHPHFNSMDGVYIVWHGGSDAATLLVGQGVIRDQIRACRTDPRIQLYANKGLYVTWAAAPAEERSAIVASLCDQLRPAIPVTISDTRRISVNLPW